ncbi:hypothetical protein EMIT0P176_20020 [Pseudomonas sp. IT-P176]
MGMKWTASTLVIHCAGLLHHRHLPALRLQAGELTRSNQAALLPHVEAAAHKACKGLQSLVWRLWRPDQILILVNPAPCVWAL